MILINKIIKDENTHLYEPVEYFIPGLFDLKIHQNGDVSLHERDSLYNKSGTTIKSLQLAEKNRINITQYKACCEKQQENENDDELFYIETEVDVEKSQLIIYGAQDDFRTIMVDTRGSQYKLKTSEGKVVKAMGKAAYKFNGLIGRKSMIVR